MSIRNDQINGIHGQLQFIDTRNNINNAGKFRFEVTFTVFYNLNNDQIADYQ
jgi:hypothetical protein